MIGYFVTFKLLKPYFLRVAFFNYFFVEVVAKCEEHEASHAMIDDD
jgi:hypothetical protein